MRLTQKTKPFLCHFLFGNVDGLHSKIADKRYVEQFDVACLTFVDNSYDLTKYFTGYDKYVFLAVKLSHHGRRLGGVALSEEVLFKTD